jgi:hypothetical protein
MLNRVLETQKDEIEWTAELKQQVMNRILHEIEEYQKANEVPIKREVVSFRSKPKPMD